MKVSESNNHLIRTDSISYDCSNLISLLVCYNVATIYSFSDFVSVGLLIFGPLLNNFLIINLITNVN